MAELGALLRQAREDRGISLGEAEQATRIRRVFLQAIEEDRYGDLPGEVYGRGFVRSYARYLGLDPDVLLQQYPRAAIHEPIHVPEMLDEPLTPLAHRLTRWLAVVLLLGMLLAGVWYLYDTCWVDRGWRVLSLWPPAVGVPTAPIAEPAPAPTDTLPAVMRTPAENQGTQPQRPTAGPEPQETPAAAPTATATPRPPTPTPTVTPTPYIGVNIAIVAQADTYLEIRADGELLWIGILRALESGEWSAEELMQLRIGNAGGIQLLLNGQDVGPLGASGQVINVEYRAGDLP